MTYDTCDLYDLSVGDRFVEAPHYDATYTVVARYPGGDGVDVLETKDPKGRIEQWWYTHPQGRPSVARVAFED